MCISLCDSESYSVMSDSLWPHGLYSPWNSPGQNTGVDSLSHLQAIFPAQESNPGLQNCRGILFQLNHQGSPRILEWVAYPFSSGSSRPRNQTGVSCIAGEFFTNRGTREAQCIWKPQTNRIFLHQAVNPGTQNSKENKGFWIEHHSRRLRKLKKKQRLLTLEDFHSYQGILSVCPHTYLAFYFAGRQFCTTFHYYSVGR